MIKNSAIKQMNTIVKAMNEEQSDLSEVKVLLIKLGEAQSTISCLESENRELKEETNELLAVMHGDGGHYTSSHGIIKSIKDAVGLLHTKWVTNEHLTDINKVNEQRDALKAELEEMKDLITELSLYGIGDVLPNSVIDKIKSFLSKSKRQSNPQTET